MELKIELLPNEFSYVIFILQILVSVIVSDWFIGMRKLNNPR